jgi:hypothetical protein
MGTEREFPITGAGLYMHAIEHFLRRCTVRCFVVYGRALSTICSCGGHAQVRIDGGGVLFPAQDRLYTYGLF